MQRLRRQSFVLAEQARRLPERGVEIVVEDASTALPLLLAWCREEGIEVESATESVPLFDDIFVKLIEQESALQEERIQEDLNV
jgi:hypothetical protein